MLPKLAENVNHTILRPLVPVTGAVLGGVLLQMSLPFLVPGVLLVVGAVAFGLTVVVWRRKRWQAATILLLLGCVALGALRSGLAVRASGPFDLGMVPEEVLSQQVWLEGQLHTFPERLRPEGAFDRQERLRFLAKISRIQVRGRTVDTSGIARLSVIGGGEDWQYGDQFAGWFRLRRPRGYLNPGGFSYRRYAAARGFTLEGWAKAANVERIGRNGGSRLLRAIYRFRTLLQNRLAARFSDPERGLLRAVVLGDRTGLGRATQEVFLRSGTYHILVISGLHVGFVAGALFWVAGWLRFSSRAAAVVTAISLIAYALLTGGSPPVVRAVLMACLYLLARVLGRQGDALNAIACAALVLVLHRPVALFDPSVQLTFAATLGIVLMLDRVPLPALRAPGRIVAGSLLISTAAMAATLPLLAFHFNRVSMLGLIANLVIVPLAGVLSIVGLAYTLVLAWWPHGIGPIEVLLGWLARLAIGAATWFAGLPTASLRVFTPTLGMVLSYYLILLAISIPRCKRRGVAVAGGCALLLLGQVAWALSPAARPPLRVTFLDVGQGDAILFELPGGRRMLVDGGGRYDDRFDVGERVVAPYLWYRWVGHLDVVVLSHPQPDHLNGLRAILAAFSVGEVWESGLEAPTAAYREFRALVKDRGIRRRVLRRGDRLALGPGTSVEILHPGELGLIPKDRARSAVVNNHSLVVRVNVKGVGILLTGDVEEAAEREMAARGAPLCAFLLKVPHHGSRTSSSESFLDRVGPVWAVAQAGHRNPFGHPHPRVVARYAARGARLFRTDRDGAFVVELVGGKTLRGEAVGSHRQVEASLEEVGLSQGRCLGKGLRSP
ncbi:MAG: DNA internalization-related competence protein ComEC/Rec2 [Candidatus Methylomirabilales bacterium]